MSLESDLILLNATTAALVASADALAVNVSSTAISAAEATASAVLAEASAASVGGYQTVVTAAGTTTLTSASEYLQVFTGATTQTVVLPDVTTLALGRCFRVVNNSTGAVTVNSSGGNAVVVLPADTSAMIACVLLTGTTAASWDGNFSGARVVSGKKVTFNNTMIFSATDGFTYTMPAITGTLATLGGLNQTFTGAMTFSATTGTFGSNTATSTYGVGSGATLSGSTKTINIGTAGVSGSITNTNIGSAVAGATGTVTVYQPMAARQIRRNAPVTKAASFTLAEAENWLVCNGAASVTVTLPTAASNVGREVMLTNIAAFTVVSASSNIIPITGGAAGTAILPATPGSWCTLVCDGTNWRILQS